MVIMEEKIKNLYLDAVRKTELDAQLLELAEQKQVLEEALNEQRQETEREQRDVDALERLSVKSLLLSLRGKKEDALKKERMEARDARVQQEITEAELETVNKQLETITQERQALSDCQEQFWSVFPDLFRAFYNEGKVDREATMEPEVELISAAKQQKELLEAYHRGKEAREQINVTLRSLKDVVDAEQAAIAPASEVVRKMLVQTQQELNALRESLCTFKEELLDLALPSDLRFDVHEVLKLRDDALLGTVGSAEVRSQYQHVSVLMHPAVTQLEAILPFLEQNIAVNDLRLQRARLSLAQLIME